MNAFGLVMGGGELILLTAILVLIFGASRMSNVGEKVREMIGNFRQSMRNESVDEESAQEKTS